MLHAKEYDCSENIRQLSLSLTESSGHQLVDRRRHGDLSPVKSLDNLTAAQYKTVHHSFNQIVI